MTINMQGRSRFYMHPLNHCLESWLMLVLCNVTGEIMGAAHLASAMAISSSCVLFSFPPQGIALRDKPRPGCCVFTSCIAQCGVVYDVPAHFTSRRNNRLNTKSSLHFTAAVLSAEIGLSCARHLLLLYNIINTHAHHIYICCIYAIYRLPTLLSGSDHRGYSISVISS